MQLIYGVYSDEFNNLQTGDVEEVLYFHDQEITKAEVVILLDDKSSDRNDSLKILPQGGVWSLIINWTAYLRCTKRDSRVQVQ